MRTLTFTAVGLLAIAGAFADEPPAHHAWKVGDLIETELSSAGELYEKSPEGDFRGKHTLKLHYVDRVDEVSDGKVTKISRHVYKAAVTEDGEDLGELGLTGRTLTLTRGEKGKVQGTYGAGGRVVGAALELVQGGPWPDVDRTWRLDLGAREGSLAGVKVDGFDGKDVPPPVVEALKTCGFTSLSKGSWKLTPREGFKPTGSLKLQLELEGKEALEEGGDLIAGQTTTLELTRRKARAQTLPADQPPVDAEPAYEDEDDDMGGDLDEPPYPEDDEDPYPEPEPAPEPDDDEDWGR